MVKTTYFEEYKLGASRQTLGRTITESDIVTHAGQTGDFFPHHVDAVKILDSIHPLPRRIARHCDR